MRQRFENGLSRAFENREFKAVDETTNVETRKSSWVGKPRKHRNNFVLTPVGSSSDTKVATIEFIDYQVATFIHR